MPLTMKKLAEIFTNRETGLTQGHRMCPGCAAPMTVKMVLMVAKALGYEPVIGFATGCMEVSSTIFPYTSWSVPYIHNAFENVAATISGVETAYRALKKAGKVPSDKKYAFIAFGGDGGTYDIGLQSLSGALERGHKMLYVLYDNEGYMNTGNQRSGSTPPGADTTTAPVGKVVAGKLQLKKNIVEIVAAHENVYAATVTPGEPMDFINKVEKALQFDGPAFIASLSPCVRYWRMDESKSVDITKLAVQTKYWPLYEVERGVYRVTRKPTSFKPVAEFVKAQGRFRLLLQRPDAEQIISELQNYVDRRWERLLAFEEATKNKPVR